MVHYKKTNVAIKRHEGEFAASVIVDNAGDFVSKCPKAEDVDNGMIINVVNEIEEGVNNRDVIVLDGFDDAGHDGVRDGDEGTDGRSFQGSASNAFPGLFHLAC
jgi:hypothetical protein